MRALAGPITGEPSVGIGTGSSSSLGAGRVPNFDAFASAMAAASVFPAFAQERARSLRGEQELGSPEARRDAPLQAAAVLGGEILVRKVDVGLDHGQGAEEPVDKLRHVTRKRTPKDLPGGGQGPLAARVYEIHDRLGLAEVHAAVEKSPLREFPGPRRPAAAREKVGEYLARDERAAVAGDLERVLAGVGVGARE